MRSGKEDPWGAVWNINNSRDTLQHRASSLPTTTTTCTLCQPQQHGPTHRPRPRLCIHLPRGQAQTPALPRRRARSHSRGSQGTQARRDVECPDHHDHCVWETTEEIFILRMLGALGENHMRQGSGGARAYYFGLSLRFWFGVSLWVFCLVFLGATHVGVYQSASSLLILSCIVNFLLSPFFAFYACPRCLFGEVWSFCSLFSFVFASCSS